MSTTNDSTTRYTLLNGTQSIPVQEFIAMPDNPVQRDTELRASAAVRRHLSAPNPAHTRVTVAVITSTQQWFKVNGHTRAYLWADGRLALPTTVGGEPITHIEAEVWECRDLEAVKAVYRLYDSPEAVDTGTDRVQSAYREAGIAPRSDRLRSGTGVAGVLAHVEALSQGRPNPVQAKSLPLTAAVLEHAEGLMAIDALAFKARELPPAYLTAALLTLKKHGAEEGSDALTFLRAVQGKQGVCTGDDMDAVYAVFSYPKSQEFLRLNARKGSSSLVRSNMVAVYLNAFTSWVTDPDRLFGKYPSGAQRVLCTFHPYRKGAPPLDPAPAQAQAPAGDTAAA